MNFSLILPSRERVGLLESLLCSIQSTTKDLDNVQVWVAIDWDDALTVRCMKPLRQRFPWLDFLVTDRQSNLTTGYYDRLAKLSTGRYIQVLNDDCIFVTEHWDALALDEIAKVPWADRIFYGRVADDLRCAYACFPLLSRELFNALGWVFHPEFPGWGADIHLHDVMQRVGRVWDMPYHIDHISHHSGKRERDQVNERMGQISSYNFGSAPGEAQRLRNIINCLSSR